MFRQWIPVNWNNFLLFFFLLYSFVIYIEFTKKSIKLIVNYFIFYKNKLCFKGTAINLGIYHLFEFAGRFHSTTILNFILFFSFNNLSPFEFLLIIFEVSWNLQCFIIPFHIFWISIRRCWKIFCRRKV